MEQRQYIYLPKDKQITYKTVERPAGFIGKNIHMHDHHELVLVESSSTFSLINNGMTQEAIGPCLIFHKAGTFHEVTEILNGAYISRVVFFHPQTLADIPEKLLYSNKLFSGDITILPLTNQEFVSISPLFDMLSARNFEQQLPLLLTILAAASQVTFKESSIINKSAPVSYIFEIIELLHSTTEDISISILSSKYHVSPTKLKSDFKKIAGMPVIAYKNKLRLDRAQIMLLTTKYTLAEIAYNCGFSDESYFIRAFKKAYQCTPAAYRKSSHNMD